MRAVCAILTAVAFLCPIAGCGQKNGKVIARVNGQTISETEVVQRLINRYGLKVVEDLIDEHLIIQEAKRRGVSVPKAEVKRELRQEEGRYASKSEFRKALRRMGFTFAQFKRRIELDLLVEAMSRQEVTVSETEVDSYYRSHKDEFNIPERVRLRNILVETKAQAQTIWQALKKPGSQFDELARKFSIDPASKDTGGDMGVVPIKDLQSPVLKVVQKLQPGQISEPFELHGQWCIVKLEQLFPAQVRPLRAIREQIRRLLFDQKVQLAKLDFVRKLRQKADIIIYDERFRSEE